MGCSENCYSQPGERESDAFQAAVIPSVKKKLCSSCFCFPILRDHQIEQTVLLSREMTCVGVALTTQSNPATLTGDDLAAGWEIGSECRQLPRALSKPLYASHHMQINSSR